MWKLSLCVALLTLLSSPSEGLRYDPTAYTECKSNPERALYNGGILKGAGGMPVRRVMDNGGRETANETPAFVLRHLSKDTRYSFSCWIRLEGQDSALIKARLSTENSTQWCIGSSLAKAGCWSFLKGGFILDSPSINSILYFHNTINDSDAVISVASASLQPFTVEEWRTNQEDIIRTKRKREVVIHVSDAMGNRITGANVSVEQISRDFPFGSAINKNILSNPSYQAWFTDRFNVAVFEDELKWYATELKRGEVNYSVADTMLEFVRSKQVVVRGHNIFWEDPRYTPPWVLKLNSKDLTSAVERRIRSLMERYRGEFVHWDVSNEMLHFNLYEQRLGSNASLQFFRTAREIDPLATVFMNEFNVVESCIDDESTVDYYVERVKELARGGVSLQGIGLEGHFTNRPNLLLVRATIDKLATLGMPIWLTEVDIAKNMSHQTQAVYLEEVLREGFSHESVNGIVMWTALKEGGCYQMCLTDMSLRNLPAGDVVDKLLEEWGTGRKSEVTNEHGTCSFRAFLGEYSVKVNYQNRSTEGSFSLNGGDETRHVIFRI